MFGVVHNGVDMALVHHLVFIFNERGGAGAGGYSHVACPGRSTIDHINLVGFDQRDVALPSTKGRKGAPAMIYPRWWISDIVLRSGGAPLCSPASTLQIACHTTSGSEWRTPRTILYTAIHGRRADQRT